MISPEVRSGTVINNTQKNRIFLENIKNKTLPQS